VLEADRVSIIATLAAFMPKSRQMTESDGTVIHAERFDLTDDFRDGFIESLRAILLQNPIIGSRA